MDMILNRYFLHRNESELRAIEKDLEKYLNVPFVRCSYDAVISHKYKDKNEIAHRRNEVKEWEDEYSTLMLDYVINYEKYETKEDYDENGGGYDGEVYELHYLKGNGNYIVITGIDE